MGSQDSIGILVQDATTRAREPPRVTMIWCSQSAPQDRVHGRVDALCADGEFDAETLGRLKTATTAAIDHPEVRRIVLDITAVTFADSSTLNVMLILLRTGPSGPGGHRAYPVGPASGRHRSQPAVHDSRHARGGTRTVGTGAGSGQGCWSVRHRVGCGLDAATCGAGADIGHQSPGFVRDIRG
ncbi:STAS domain-containing protein [Streptomyces sp. NBC_00424]|uniref:STAS domain-containing protein n=1 Tax=unclassified Streptomyces TaxID=2593676 RepID=UPI00338F13EB